MQELILGIDPGSRSTGYAIIAVEQNKQNVVTYGFIRCQQNETNQRLYHIYEKLSEIIAQYQPCEAAIEQVFSFVNPQSALKLGQARGAALAATARYALDVGEYSAKQIKQAVVSYGAATKTQVQHMVKSLLNLSETPQADAADALAVAICHANQRHLNAILKKGATL